MLQSKFASIPKDTFINTKQLNLLKRFDEEDAFPLFQKRTPTFEFSIKKSKHAMIFGYSSVHSELQFQFYFVWLVVTVFSLWNPENHFLWTCMHVHTNVFSEFHMWVMFTQQVTIYLYPT